MTIYTPPVYEFSDDLATVKHTSLCEATIHLPGRAKRVPVVRRPDSVAILVLRTSTTGELELLTVDQPRPAVLDDRCRELPAGGIDAGEADPILVGRRELAEECGLLATHWETVLGGHWPSPGCVNETLHTVMAWGELTSVPQRAEDSHITMQWLPLSDALGQIGREIRDMKTIIAIQWVTLNRDHLTIQIQP